MYQALPSAITRTRGWRRRTTYMLVTYGACSLRYAVFAVILVAVTPSLILVWSSLMGVATLVMADSK